MPEQDVSDGLRNEVLQLSEDSAISQSDVGADKELQRAFRDLAKRSLYFWTRAILGYDKLTKEAHLPLCDFLQDLSKKNELVLLPRGTFKTVCGSTGFASRHAVTVDPDTKILIANQRDG